MITDAIRDAFALALVKFGGDELGAALSVVPDNDLGIALELCAQAKADRSFPDRQRSLIEASGAEQYLPSKEGMAVEILQIARVPENNADLRLRAYRLSAELLGYIDKGGVQVNLNKISNRVMVVPLYNDPEKWEAAAIDQQAKLIDAAYTAKNTGTA
jgi:hypothetical protein